MAKGQFGARRELPSRVVTLISKPRPLQIWDRRADERVTEWMKDSPQTYETHPRRSFRNLLESHPLYDWALALYQNSSWSRREIAPFIRDHAIDMTPFEPVRYQSFTDFFDRRFRLGARAFTPLAAAWAGQSWVGHRCLESTILPGERLRHPSRVAVVPRSPGQSGGSTGAMPRRSRGNAPDFARSGMSVGAMMAGSPMT
jgi:hypothetical protein